jgi:hypothetical protein
MAICMPTGTFFQIFGMQQVDLAIETHAIVATVGQQNHLDI